MTTFLYLLTRSLWRPPLTWQICWGFIWWCPAMPAKESTRSWWPQWVGLRLNSSCPGRSSPPHSLLLWLGPLLFFPTSQRVAMLCSRLGSLPLLVLNECLVGKRVNTVTVKIDWLMFAAFYGFDMILTDKLMLAGEVKSMSSMVGCSPELYSVWKHDFKDYVGQPTV